jgi:hypothetical protein
LFPSLSKSNFADFVDLLISFVNKFNSLLFEKIKDFSVILLSWGETWAVSSEKNISRRGGIFAFVVKGIVLQRDKRKRGEKQKEYDLTGRQRDKTNYRIVGLVTSFERGKDIINMDNRRRRKRTNSLAGIHASCHNLIRGTQTQYE